MGKIEGYDTRLSKYRAGGYTIINVEDRKVLRHTDRSGVVTLVETGAFLRRSASGQNKKIDQAGSDKQKVNK